MYIYISSKSSPFKTLRFLLQPHLPHRPGDFPNWTSAKADGLSQVQEFWWSIGLMLMFKFLPNMANEKSQTPMPLFSTILNKKKAGIITWKTSSFTKAGAVTPFGLYFRLNPAPNPLQPTNKRIPFRFRTGAALGPVPLFWASLPAGPSGRRS